MTTNMLAFPVKIFSVFLRLRLTILHLLPLTGEPRSMASLQQHSTYSSVTLDSSYDLERKLIDSTNSTADPYSGETDSLLHNDAGAVRHSAGPDWNYRNTIKMIGGTGVGSLLEFYSFGLVAYFEPSVSSLPNDTAYCSIFRDEH